MATSRTGTAQWKRVRDQALAEAKDAGLTRCPLCGNGLDWTRSLQPNSPEVDHIVPHALGGQDVIENCRVICRLDNQRLGAIAGRSRRKPTATVALAASDIW
ncbi:HNH endonuclease [Sinomonas susongensis]|uniref:HNH endonuclease n=1 Tax=Sinomonas susongensis TaxID=1324851 RepID=UPI003CCC69A2